VCIRARVCRISYVRHGLLALFVYSRPERGRVWVDGWVGVGEGRAHYCHEIRLGARLAWHAKHANSLKGRSCCRCCSLAYKLHVHADERLVCACTCKSWTMFVYRVFSAVAIAVCPESGELDRDGLTLSFYIASELNAFSKGGCFACRIIRMLFPIRSF
jgi:hypothetical protein